MPQDEWTSLARQFNRTSELPILRNAAVNRQRRRAIGLLLAICWSAGLAGCSDGRRAVHPVRGTVHFANGQPLTQGIVEFESTDEKLADRLNARGEIQPDGTFRLSTYGPAADGAVAGRHRAMVVVPQLDDLPAAARQPIIHRKFSRYETSGLEFDVGPGENEFDITVAAP